MIVSHEASNQPGDLWIYNIGRRHAEQLTFSSIASLSAIPLPPAHIVHYKTFDGKIITALLWMPFNLKRDGSNPALVIPHGGPTGQRIDYWSPEVQALASRGYICIAPNPRGSTGYGLEFQKANFQDLGGGDLKDEIAGVEFLKATGYVDAKKIGMSVNMASAQDIQDFCKDQIAHYKIPRYIKFVDAFPMTVTGKVQKFVMREQMSKELGLLEEKTA